ncbi:hypothetical protein ES332_A12G153400v1 [Gossypium tomentosum]|uniref:Uncharacterized protein n=1 Tax=Gossypium tomentosum TaxID=34277 RepID=A0A5D2MWZ3_GOSTO|nr:hypothetical protein ES332_A12G153400v1 [Gossypium tomentosum]
MDDILIRTLKLPPQGSLGIVTTTNTVGREGYFSERSEKQKESKRGGKEKRGDDQLCRLTNGWPGNEKKGRVAEGWNQVENEFGNF